jgi:hypothetical protein
MFHLKISRVHFVDFTDCRKLNIRRPPPKFAPFLFNWSSNSKSERCDTDRYEARQPGDHISLFCMLKKRKYILKWSKRKITVIL